jgi:hypothetical protein
MPRRPCLVCGTPTSGTRCPPHQQAWDSRRNARRTQYHGAWQGQSKRARQAWVEEHGWWCPGLGTPPHHAHDLELDHTTGRVLCHTCNVHAGPAGGGGKTG